MPQQESSQHALQNTSSPGIDPKSPTYGSVVMHLVPIEGLVLQAREASAASTSQESIRQYHAFTELFDNLPNVVLDETVPVPASTLWQALFGSDALMAKFYDRQQYTNLVMQPWEDNSAYWLPQAPLPRVTSIPAHRTPHSDLRKTHQAHPFCTT